MKIVIAPDSFKGTLTAREATAAMAEGVLRVWPHAQIVLLPLADGGEGTADALISATQGRLVTAAVTGPLGEPVEASFGILGSSGLHDPGGCCAVVEMAQAAGLGLVPADRRDPRITTTNGVGELLRAAVDRGATEIIVGLGGSATNDGGAGAMRALGARFLDGNANELPDGGAALGRLARIDMGGFVFPVGRVSVTAASDVRNPLIGPNGASAVYGPQKGATSEMVAELDAALANYAAIVKRDLGVDVADLPGAGAAGGLGAALAAFLEASFKPGIDVVLDVARFETQVAGADLVLTGEGRLDGQTLCGKTISGLLSRANGLRIPVGAFGGSADTTAVAELRARGLLFALPLVQGAVTLEQAMSRPYATLADAVARELKRRRDFGEFTGS
jgi:glycerate kinase